MAANSARASSATSWARWGGAWIIIEGENKAAQRHSRLNRSHLLFLFFAVSIASAINAVNPDLWMHLAAGRLFLDTHHVPRVDIYSYSAAGLPWRDHEWLSQAVFAFAYDRFGVLGLRLLKLLCALVTLGAIDSALGRTDASPRAQRLILIVTAVALAPYMHYRPQLFTFCLLGIEMALLWANYMTESAALWMLIPIFAAWANLHGGFVAGLGALGIYTATVCAESRLTGSRRRCAALVAITTGAALATLLNPFGAGAWLNVFHSVLDQTIHRAILEWAPTWVAMRENLANHPSEVLDAMPLALPIALVVVAVRTRAVCNYPFVAIALVFSIAALFSMRNLPLAAIVVAPILGAQIALQSRLRGDETQSEEAGELSPALVTIAGAIVLILGALPSATALREGSQYPHGAIAFMKSHGLNGNILNEYGWGAYIVWNAAPRSRVFIDTRSELVYPDRVLADYLAFMSGSSAGAKLLDERRHDFVLIRPKGGAYRLASEDRRWKLIYHDHACALFARSDGSAALIPGAASASETDRGK
jgi:hypothetical protein